MADVRCTQHDATTIMYDNQGSMSLAKNPTHHSQTKHIDVQYHFIGEKFEMKMIELKYCPTDHMTTDVLTKAVGRDLHRRLMAALELEGFGYSQSGSVEVG